MLKSKNVEIVGILVFFLEKGMICSRVARLKIFGIIGFTSMCARFRSGPCDTCGEIAGR